MDKDKILVSPMRGSKHRYADIFFKFESIENMKLLKDIFEKELITHEIDYEYGRISIKGRSIIG